MVRRIGEKADQSDVNESLQQHQSRVQQLEATFLQIIEEVEQLHVATTKHTQEIKDIAAY